MSTTSSPPDPPADPGSAASGAGTPGGPGHRGPEWLEALFRAHHRQVLAYAVRRLGPQAAEDVMAEVFATAWRVRDTVPDPALPWLYRTAANHVLHARRSAARRERLATRLTALADHRDPAAGGSAIGEPVADAIGVRETLASLPDRDAEILMLHAWEDLTPTQIGYVVGCSATTARVRLHRARRRARAALESRQAAPPAPAKPVLVTKEPS